MSEKTARQALVVGAGAVGVIYGYVLSLAKVEVTFLVRPHRVEALGQPQVLYSYNDHQLKTFSEYKYISDPSEIRNTTYDYVLVTLDGAALLTHAGLSVVKTIGAAVKGTNTIVFLGGIMLDMKKWFMQISGLDANQVFVCLWTIHVYSPKLVSLPQHAPTDGSLLSQADWAYADKWPVSMMIVDDSDSATIKEFTEVYNTNGVSSASPVPSSTVNVTFMPMFAVFAGLTLLGWPDIAVIANVVSNEGSAEWKLAVNGFKEMQELKFCGEEGVKAAEKTTEESVLEFLKSMAAQLLPLDMMAFNKYHHGGKVGAQDAMLLRDYIAAGEEEGKSMDGLKELVRRTEELSAR